MQSLVSTRFKADLKGAVESGEDGGGRALDVEKLIRLRGHSNIRIFVDFSTWMSSLNMR